jgi:hypothetical protein
LCPTFVLPQVGAMITYILDALRYREGTFGAVWLALGATNLSLVLSGASFSRSRPILMGVLMAASTGSLLFLTGGYNLILSSS